MGGDSDGVRYGGSLLGYILQQVLFQDNILFKTLQ